MGGITPGQTTDTVSAVLAESIAADVLINITSVDGIYSADPRKDPAAVRFPTLTPRQLSEIVRGERLTAGSNTVFDLVAAKVIERSGIPLVVFEGKNPEHLRSAIFHGEFVGTVVSEEKKSPLPFVRK
jgi:uridylate kinase